MLEVGSDFSGVGAFDQALISLGIPYKTVFACDMDKYARRTYCANYGTKKDIELSKTLLIQAELAKEFSFYFPENVYDREIPEKSLDIFVTSPPCQGFSLAGKREGSILFFNSHEFIMKNRPRFFIFENVKGLLSHEKKDKLHDYGQTFREWLNYLGGKSVNGIPTIFPTDEAAPYHIYHTVLNAKNHGIPQNRERVFIVGIRDDDDNVFSWPKEVQLTKRLIDVLEDEVDEKYFLSGKMVDYLLNRSGNFNGGKINFKTEKDIASTITKSSGSIDISDNIIKIGNTNPSGNGMNGNVFDSNGIAPTISTNKGEGIKIGTWRTHKDGQGFREISDGNCPTIPARSREDGSGQPVIMQRGHGFVKDSVHDISPTITGGTWKDNNSVCIPVLTPDRPNKRQNGRRFKEDGDPSFTITTQDKHGVYDGYNIRRLTPIECFRLMGFPDSLVENARKAGVSDSQLYKQAGNSIYTGCLIGIINGMKKLIK